MEITIQNEQDMPAMQRKDYRARAFHEGATPRREELRKAMAKQLKAKDALVIVRKVSAAFGNASSIVDVSVYRDEGALERFEPAYIVKRHGGAKEEASAAPEPKEAPKEEAAKEEPKGAAAEEAPAKEGGG